MSDSLIQRLDKARSHGPGALAQACAALLAEARGVDTAAAARAVSRDRELGGLIAETASAERLAACLQDLAQAARCIGCATCCRTSSPTLYAEDLPRLKAAALGWESLVTLRAGDKVYSARLGGLQALEHELIKLRERGGACAWLGEGGCGIYEQRPLQCRWLECWSGRHAGQLGERPRLSREELLAEDQTALALAREYEVKLPAAELDQALAEAAQGQDQAPALAMLELDHVLRTAISERYGYSPEALYLVLGRPAREVAGNYGLELSLEGETLVLRSKS
ncbi:MAG: YkgJ family cysteine cluster protein [Proteobacteria bacterium]|nr:YkgJ family cysteine cluster protein [Pseudomonadota bacterium]MBU4383056.1 YkgJ family cysteine cluster protein [Pseudomonadota bacterium]MBU4606564.1 YkgJ family cysteine cluster protein [Pseudomonadota bacterium]MCG2762840.1 YkgJ family cysteine cluster protein [Desulfarculaceae bacterium]